LTKNVKNEAFIKQYMGWKPKSNTILKYQHLFQNAGLNAVLEADGLILQEKIKTKIRKTFSNQNLVQTVKNLTYQTLDSA